MLGMSGFAKTLLTRCTLAIKQSMCEKRKRKVCKQTESFITSRRAGRNRTSPSHFAVNELSVMCDFRLTRRKEGLPFPIRN